MRPAWLLLAAATLALAASEPGRAQRSRSARPAPPPPAEAEPPPPAPIDRSDPYLFPRRKPDAEGAPSDRAREPRRELAAPADAPGLDLARRYFHMCDADSDGFVSFPEARASLGLDRDAFGVYDQDVDGLCNEEEFRARYEAILARGGSFRPPAVPAGLEETRTRARASDVLAAGDENADSLIDAEELARVLEAHTLEGLDRQAVLEAVDVDGSGRLDAGELVRLLPLLSREEDAGAFAKRQPRSLEELYGRPEAREGGPDWAPEPPLVRGPIAYFLRLDIDRDERISEDDLKSLLRPLKVPVRLNTVLADLDRDGDGAISREELRRSMERP